MGLSAVLGISPDTLTVIILAGIGGVMWFVREIYTIKIHVASLQTRMDYYDQKSTDGGNIKERTISEKMNYFGAFSAILGFISAGFGILGLYGSYIGNTLDLGTFIIGFFWAVMGGIITLAYGLKYTFIKKIPKIVVIIGILLGWSFAIIVIITMLS